MPKRKRLASAAAVLVCFLSAPGLVRAQDAQQPAPDNTRANKDQSKPTADQQKVNPSDRSIAQQIRKAIHEDTTLSTYAHNVKIISQDGKVTLRGPVRSEDEKSNIEAKAVAVAGQGNVTNELTVAPPK
jgi:hyperosmotically inducible periplasmic protein